MPKLSRLSGQEVIKTLQKFGFLEIRQKGSHVILKRRTPEGEIGCVVPLHKELAIGTLKGTLKQAKLLHEDFLEKL
jgi:predicted RNA binding protein YcfA (HicA-like mRNA interferase family)